MRAEYVRHGFVAAEIAEMEREYQKNPPVVLDGLEEWDVIVPTGSRKLSGDR
jgi:hypothetical protein